MARTIETIQQGIIDTLDPKGNELSTSKYALWRLLSHAVAVGIHLFEVILDMFREEVNEKAYMSAACTVTWYREICLQFQYGHTLVYNSRTAGYSYAVDDPETRIIKMVAITDRRKAGDRALYIKVAKQNAECKMIPLTSTERRDFTAYLERRGGAGIPIVITSTAPDTILYDIDVHYDPSYPYQAVYDGVVEALETFKTTLDFDAKFYSQRLLDKVMATDGVVTVNPISIQHKTSEKIVGYKPAGVVVELTAGYFEYDGDCNLTFISTAE